VKLELFSVHGHEGDRPVDYLELFRAVARMGPRTRTETVADRVAAIPSFREEEGKFFFTAYTGSAEATFLVLDLEASTEEERSLETGKVVVRRTLGVIDPARREAVVQFVHHGLRSHQIAQLLERFARQADPAQFRDLALEFAPVPGASFLEELRGFSRIQSAMLRLARPNYDWEDYGQTLETLGQESGARNLEVAAVANRNGSLSKQNGLVGLMKDLVQRGRSIIKGASVTGSRGDHVALVTLNLTNHIEAINAEVPTGATGQPVEAQVRQIAAQFLGSRGEQDQ
jgi:hypothetical protein